MRGLVALLISLLAITAADARCWKRGQNVSEYQDRYTSTGDYSYQEPRCASREYPFGAYLKITHRGHSTTCKVDDYGPAPWTKCIVDVNVVAKKQLRMGSRGVIKAKIERVDEPQKKIVVASLGFDEAGFTLKEAAHTVARGSLDLLQRAKAYMGRNPTGWHSLWCAHYMAFIAPQLARRLSNPNLAREWADLPHVKPQVGAIVVLSRGRGGHVGVVSGFDRRGNPRVVSGNHGHVVGEGVYPKRRVIAYVGA